jgi:hypothetical protein
MFLKDHTQAMDILHFCNSGYNFVIAVAGNQGKPSKPTFAGPTAYYSEGDEQSLYPHPKSRPCSRPTHPHPCYPIPTSAFALYRAHCIHGLNDKRRSLRFDLPFYGCPPNRLWILWLLGPASLTYLYCNRHWIPMFHLYPYLRPQSFQTA